MADSKAGGRPTKYSDEMLSIAQDYIINYADHDQVIPSIAGLAVKLQVARSTLYEWAKIDGNTEFSYTLESLSANQEVKLINSGLNRTFEPGLTKLLLCNHGHGDPSDDEDASPAPSTVVIEVRDARK